MNCSKNYPKDWVNSMTAPAPDRRAIITEALRKIDDLTARLAIAEKATTEPIAVVGVGCRLPGGVTIEVLRDRSTTIRASVHEVQTTLLLSVALVIGVTAVFLRRISAVIATGAAVPLSLLGTLFGVTSSVFVSLNSIYTKTVLRRAVASEGVGVLYRGLSLNWFKGPAATAVSFCTFEALRARMRQQDDDAR